MIRIVFGFAGLTLLAFAQSSPPFKSYKTHDDYCRDNPKMPTCIKTGPIGPINQTGIYKPRTTVAPPTVPKTSASPRAMASQQPPRMRSISQVPLHDWRFSHSSPAMLINVNIKSLLQSPMWKTLFSTWAAAGTADLEKAGSALSDIGQVLISLGPSHTAGPSVLMKAMGNVDSPLGALLRSSAGMQSKRLDAFSMLVGDADSVQTAAHRMQSSFPQKTSNSLQQTATLESMKYDIWVGIDPRRLPGMASMLGIAPSQTINALAVLRNISVGIYLRDQIRIEAGIEAPSPEIAQKLLVAFQKKEAESQVWVTADGAKVQYIAIADAKDLKSGAGLDAATTQMIAPHIASAIQSLAKLESSPRAAAPASAPKAIVIQGLDTEGRRN